MNKNTILLKTILEIQTELRSNIDELNMGGCGFFAIIMYSVMKRYGFNCKIVFYSSREKKIINNIFNEIKSKNFNNAHDLSVNHVFIKYKNYFFDGHGFLFKGIDVDVTGEFSIKELALSLKYGKWNSKFSPNHNILQTIKFIIENEFKRSFPVTN